MNVTPQIVARSLHAGRAGAWRLHGSKTEESTSESPEVREYNLLVLGSDITRSDSQTLIMVSTFCSHSVWLLSTSRLTFTPATFWKSLQNPWFSHAWTLSLASACVFRTRTGFMQLNILPTFIFCFSPRLLFLRLCLSRSTYMDLAFTFLRLCVVTDVSIMFLLFQPVRLFSRIRFLKKTGRGISSNLAQMPIWNQW